MNVWIVAMWNPWTWLEIICGRWLFLEKSCAGGLMVRFHVSETELALNWRRVIQGVIVWNVSTADGKHSINPIFKILNIILKLYATIDPTQFYVLLRVFFKFYKIFY